jgi:hypothetical protein
VSLFALWVFLIVGPPAALVVDYVGHEFEKIITHRRDDPTNGVREECASLALPLGFGGAVEPLR